jgi:hypothetical protein
MADFLSDADTDEEEFWQKAKTNLQAGKVRLVFVTDEIPTELRRVIEFLNQQMDPAEVLALEIKQYIGGTLRTLVPRIVGQTVEAQQKKSGVPRESRQWDEPSFCEDLKARRSPDEARVARDILEWAQTNLPRFTWGKGKQHGSFIPVLDHKGMSNYPFVIYTYGRVEIQFQHMKARPFDDETKRSGTVPIASTRTSTPRDLSRLLARCSIGYKSVAIATAPGGLLAYRLQVTLAVPGLHPRPLARLDGGRHVRQIK